ncbi:hypothetical protein M3M50_15980 [Pseudomonas bijieensis]|uniref:hypothetical protein n=1 Tax=Pseudomonas bijieensis TaxID=2681983 RepID=UPI00200FAC28|nr:hypothetical protein [Pseudomonas bijieensis]UQI28478.1 hypothetical protein M3M50_15980 [Pseudomonas bijieensis]
MNKQIFRPWDTLDLPASGRMTFERITYGSGMRIHLRETEEPGRRLYLDFPELPTAMRITNESMRLASLPLVPMEVEKSFFLVDNSEFLAWLNNDSLDIYKDDPVFHLAIVTEEWIDIICNEVPVIVFES